MSQKSAIDTEATTAKSLFLGNIIEQNLFPFPQPSATERETLEMVLESVDRFMSDKAEEFRDYDRVGAQPDDYIASLKELGLFGLIIPEVYGGIGLSNAGYSRVLQQTSRYDASTSLTIGAHSSIGMKGLLLFGSAEQKQRYLPKLASGEMIAAFCLTEAGAGSDAGSIATVARKQDDGSWLLSGEKIWITNGPLADYFTVFARTEGAHGKMSAFIVERSFGGVSHGAKEDKMGIRASATSTVTFSDVRVPAANLLGAEGDGFKVAMSILNNGRTGLGGGCVGAMKRLIALASTQARDRKQFGRSISEFELVQEKLAQMTVNCFAAESVVTMVASYIDQGVADYSVEAAMSKVFATEALWNTCFESLQIAGGNGFMREYPYELVTRDSRINLIFEGTNEILRLYIALSGMKDAGQYLKELGKGAAKVFNDPIKGFGVLSGYATKKIAQLTPFGRDRLAGISEELRGEAAVFEEYVPRLGQAVEGVLRRLGKNIIGSQHISKRLADTATDLFVGLCVVSRVSSRISALGAAACADEIALARIFTAQAKNRMAQNLRRLERNEDELMTAVAKSVLKSEGFRWDIMKEG